MGTMIGEAGKVRACAGKALGAVTSARLLFDSVLNLKHQVTRSQLDGLSMGLFLSPVTGGRHGEPAGRGRGLHARMLGFSLLYCDDVCCCVAFINA